MSLKKLIWLGFLLSVAFPAPAPADPPGLLRIFARNPLRATPEPTRELSEEDGPWLILASTFVGEESESRARRLADELRLEFRLPTFIYKENFDFTGDVAQFGERRLRYANQYEYDAYAVLVGEYDTVEHPDIDKDLARLKVATPVVFRNADDVAAETNWSNPVTAVKALHRKLVEKNDDAQKRGPMSNAFVTRNPILPPEYFESPQVDSFVRRLNEDKAYSLLQSEGKFTVVVRTFEGFGTIEGAKNDGKFVPSAKRMDRLAADADKMVKSLRKKGEEAYQYHDRKRSLVTVGSFDTLGRELPGGGFEYAPEIRQVVEKFKAFNVRPELARQVPTNSRGAAANNAAMIPFDVEPTPIAVPKVSKRSIYSSALGLR